MTKKWYSIRAASAGVAEISIYEEIGIWGVTAGMFARDLKALGDVSNITLRISSIGGNVFDGLAIYNMLKDHASTITVKVDGIAASIASVIAMAGDTIEMPANTMMMIHDPSGGVYGTAEDMREIAEVLEKVKAGLVSAYVAKTGLDANEVADLMADETWLTAEEAVAKGFADTVTDVMDIAAKADPETLKNMNAPELLVAAFARPPAAPSQPDNKEDSMSDKDKKPAGDTNAGADAERERASGIVNACNKAGYPILSAELIAKGASLDDVKAAIAQADEVKTVCATAKEINPSIDADALAAEFIAKGIGPDAVRSALMDKLSKESDAVAIVSALSSDAPSAPTNQAASRDAAVEKANRLGGYSKK